MKTKQQKLTSCEWQAISNTSLPWRVLCVCMCVCVSVKKKDAEKERKWVERKIEDRRITEKEREKEMDKEREGRNHTDGMPEIILL